MTLQQAKVLALKVLKQVMEEKLDHNNVQLAQVGLTSAPPFPSRPVAHSVPEDEQEARDLTSKPRSHLF